MITTECIVLHALDFQEYHQIATLLTKDCGVLKLVTSRSRAPKSSLFGCFQPLNLLEISYKPRGRDLEKVYSASLLHAHVEIRSSLDRLQSACSMLTTIKSTQMAQKPIPLLYALLKTYLTLLPKTDPAVLLASFQLKFLRHEGILALQSRCSMCGQEADEMAILDGQALCASHGQGIPFTKKETPLLYALALTTSASLLQQLTLSPALANKIDELYRNSR